MSTTGYRIVFFIFLLYLILLIALYCVDRHLSSWFCIAGTALSCIKSHLTFRFSMYRKIFKFIQWVSVKCFMNGLGRLDLRHIIILLIRRLKFYNHLYTSANKLLNNVFRTFYRQGSHSEQLLYFPMVKCPNLFMQILRF